MTKNLFSNTWSHTAPGSELSTNSRSPLSSLPSPLRSERAQGEVSLSHSVPATLNSQLSTKSKLYAIGGKRAFDFIAATLGLLALGIPMLGVALLILIVDGAPVFFRQKRIGRHGQPFTIYKFRTMRNRPQAGSTITVAGDQRITPLGKLLRRFKIDEFPQLLCVFTGRMSFVGPRPDVPGYMDRLVGVERRLLEVRPGITGLATLKYRDEESLLANLDDPVKFNDEVIFPHKVRLNLDYLQQCSLLLDLRIILTTIGLLRDKNNY